MTTDDLVQSINPFTEPLSKVTDESDYPNLANPLHLVILLVWCDAETMSGGILGFIENETGKHLKETVEMLTMIGATITAGKFRLVLQSMERSNVTWEAIAGDCEESEEYTISSFEDRHSSDIADRIDRVLDEVGPVFRGFQMFDPHFFEEDVYQCLMSYLNDKCDVLQAEISRRT